MNSWSERAIEEKALLSPSFCSCLLWSASSSYAKVRGSSLSFEEAFLVIALVVHRATRESLPHSVKTSLAVWLGRNPLARGQVTTRSRLLIPVTRESLLFGGIHGMLTFENGKIDAAESWKGKVGKFLKNSSDEVRECNREAAFVGKWLAKVDSASTVFAFFGARP